MEGNGPTGGKPRFVGALAASRDPFALDLVCAALIHQSPVQVPYLRAGMARNVCPESVEELILLGTSLPSLSVPDFEQPESCSVNFLDWLPKFLRPLAEKITTPVPRIQQNNCVGCGKCCLLYTSASAAVVPCAPQLSKPISSKICATESPTAGVGAKDKSTMPKGTNRRREASCATSWPIRVILNAVFCTMSATPERSQSPAWARAARTTPGPETPTLMRCV